MRLLLGVLALTALVAASGSGGASARPESLPYYEARTFTPNWSGTAHRVAPFRLRTQTGAVLTNDDLAGKIHVASFIYTRCSAICPTLVANLRRVSLAITDPRLVFVSYSVTPDLDTPEVLADFGREHRIDADRWKLVTGDARQIYALARDSYFASDERLRETLSTSDAFLHTEQVVLVDGSGRIRGVYNGTQPFEMTHLTSDIKSLLLDAR